MLFRGQGNLGTLGSSSKMQLLCFISCNLGVATTLDHFAPSCKWMSHQHYQEGKTIHEVIVDQYNYLYVLNYVSNVAENWYDIKKTLSYKRQCYLANIRGLVSTRHTSFTKNKAIVNFLITTMLLFMMLISMLNYIVCAIISS